MKKFLLILILIVLAPFSVFAFDISKDEACKLYSGKYEKTLEINGFSNPAYINNFIKKGSDLYYVVQEQKTDNFYDKNYYVYTYSCKVHKSKLLIPESAYSKVIDIIKSKIFNEMRINSIK